jgi:hypothetical protein
MQHGHNPNDPGFAQRWFYPNSSDRSIIAMSTTISSLPAWAFASITEPILKHVAESKNLAQKWGELWHGRRARPLLEAVPFETEIRRSIITGWFVAGILGLRRSEYLQVGTSVKIWNPTLEIPDWSEFPAPLLDSHSGDLRPRSGNLSGLLMSAGIALADFGKSGNPEFINGYRFLKYLGREVTTSFQGRDHWDGNGSGDILPTGNVGRSSYLMQWVTLGSKPAMNLELSNRLLKNLAANQDRSAALLKTIESIQSSYHEDWKKYLDASFDQIPETWELREDIDLALSDISEYVRSLQISAEITSD